MWGNGNYMKKVYALADVNSFFASCEKLFRPDLVHRPVVVLSNNDGCIIAACRVAKSMGIKNFVPYYQVSEFLKDKNTAVFSSNFALYADISERIMKTLAQFSPLMEVYSVDEAFLDLTGMLIEDYVIFGETIQKTVQKNIGMPISVGIGPTKVLAKVANRLAKRMPTASTTSAKAFARGTIPTKASTMPTKVIDLTRTELHNYYLSKFPVEDLWGIGRKLSKKLNSMGIYNALEYRDYDNDYRVKLRLGKLGKHIQEELRGNVCFELDSVSAPKKTIISSQTFGRPVFRKEEIQEALANYTWTAAEKLRKQNSCCNFITIYIRTNPFKEVEQYYNLKTRSFLSPTNDVRKIIAAAWLALDNIYRSGIEYKKCGVILSGIVPESQRQLSFFEEGDSEQSINLMKTIDRINYFQGERIVKSGACGGITHKSSWRRQANLKSPAYTTNWNDLPVAD